MEVEKPELSKALAIISNIIVGGLFTIQILNLWEAYNLAFLSAQLVISVVYIVYAMLILLYGLKIKSKLFRIMAVITILITTAKVFFFDLQGEATFHKVIFLLIMGTLTMLTAFIYQKYFREIPTPETSFDKKGETNELK